MAARVNMRPPVTELSPREIQALEGVARGLTHGKIAAEMGIAPSSVKTTLKRARQKLGASNSAQAAALYTKTGDEPATPAPATPVRNGHAAYVPTVAAIFWRMGGKILDLPRDVLDRVAPVCALSPWRPIEVLEAQRLMDTYTERFQADVPEGGE